MNNVWLVLTLAWMVFCCVMGYRQSALTKRLRAQLEAVAYQRDDAIGVAESARQAMTTQSQLLLAERRKSRELFDVIESVLRERDQWKTMWTVHGSEHLNAQNQLERALTSVRAWLKSSITALNAYRADKGQPLLAFGLEPNDPPIGTAAAFEALLEKAKREAPASIDGMALREAIEAKEPS